MSLPDLVMRAEQLAVEQGFPMVRDGAAPSCSLPDAGRALAMLAAGCVGGRIGEIGTGVGYGTAWMADAMPADATLVTVELDPERAAASAELFADDPRITVLHGDAGEVLPPHGPFDLLFVDGGRYGTDTDAFAALVDLVRVGGRIAMDDVTPVIALPEGSPYRDYDPKREAILGSRRLRGAELVLPDLRNSLLVGTRIA